MPNFHAAHFDELGQKIGGQAQGEVAVRDRGAVGAGFGALRIDVNPLVIQRRAGEEIDALLVNQHRRRRA
jgi:hypothetical protein